MISTSSSNRPKIRGMLLRFTAVSALAAAMAVGGSAPAQANDVHGSIAHAIYCAGLLITDPAKHLIECGVGDTSGTSSSQVGTSTKPPEDHCSWIYKYIGD